jgi:hypothetical protein
MRRLLAVGLVAATAVVGSAQTRTPVAPARRTAPLPAPQTEAADLMCPAPLGVGVTTKEIFCDVLTGRDPSAGVLITLPPHSGTVTLTFNLHNRHTYSEEEVLQHTAYRRYTATIGVLTLDNTLISRAVVQSEFRTVPDLIDRIGGGAGPAGIKAVAPTGTEPISITIPEGEEQVSILGEKLVVERQDGVTTYSEPGRPIADISQVMVEFRPPLPKRAPAQRPRAKSPAPTKKD